MSDVCKYMVPYVLRAAALNKLCFLSVQQDDSLPVPVADTVSWTCAFSGTTSKLNHAFKSKRHAQMNYTSAFLY